MRRKIIQWLALFLSNAHLSGFIEGRIYRGNLKYVCVPGLNCYSCPGALGACPLGSLQAVIGSYRYKFSFYITGLVMGFGLLFGRFICGFLCPFGLIQELLHKIPFYRVKKIWKWPIYIKYLLLAVFVVGLPTFATNAFGMGDPAFCKYICPAGTLTAGLPLLATNPSLQNSIGRLFFLKMGIALAVVIGSLAIYRFFCRFLCPLGAFYGLFNKVSLYRLSYASHQCVHCGACARACKMAIDPSATPDSPECIRCGDCVESCKFSALSSGFAKWSAAEQSKPETQ